MNENEQKEAHPGTTATDWMKSSNHFLKFLSTLSQPSTASASSEQNKKSQATDSLESMMKAWHMMTSAMDDPQSRDAFLKGNLSEVFLRIARAGWDASMEMQRKALEKAAKIGQRSEGVSVDQIDEGVFKAWHDIYEHELSQFFKIPSIGLSRYYQERFNTLVDKYNVFETAFSKFLFVIYEPFEKSKMALQEKIEELIKEGKVPEKSKDFYNMFIKTLESHYMVLFKTPEYERTLRDMLGQLNSFWMAKDEVMRDVLQVLPIPTNKEMDELYKDIYILKKRVRSLEDELKKEKKVRSAKSRKA